MRVTAWGCCGGLLSLPASTVVKSQNVERRQLTPVQKSAVAAELAVLLEEEARERQLSGLKQNASVAASVQQRDDSGRAMELAAAKIGGSARSGYYAKAVQERAPDVFEDVQGCRGGLLLLPPSADDVGRPPVITEQ